MIILKLQIILLLTKIYKQLIYLIINNISNEIKLNKLIIILN